MALRSVFTKGQVSIVFGLVILTLLMFLPFKASAEQVDGYEKDEALEYLSNPESYINYLENYSKEDAIKSGVDESYLDEAVKDAKEEASKFNSLSEDKQEKILQNMRNPEAIEKFELVISEDQEDNELGMIGLFANQRTVTHNATLSAFGIKMVEYKATGVYNYNSSGATSAVSQKGIVVKNLNPLVQTSNTSNPKSVRNGTFVGRSTFSYKIGPLKGFSVQTGTYYIEVHGNQRGKVTGFAGKE